MIAYRGLVCGGLVWSVEVWCGLVRWWSVVRRGVKQSRGGGGRAGGGVVARHRTVTCSDTVKTTALRLHLDRLLDKDCRLFNSTTSKRQVR